MNCTANSGMTSIELQQIENIAVVGLNNPPVNALSHALRESLQETLRTLAKKKSVEAIVLIGKGKHFCAGADVREFDQAALEPLLPEVITAIENLAKPIIAVIHGSALGGGLELALGCHYRVADKKSKLGLPEVNIGIIPGAGGTQRLPRLVGIENATDMITSGRHVDAAEALNIGLIDAIADSDFKDYAIQFAKKINTKPLTRVSGKKVARPASVNFFSEQITRLQKKYRGQQSPLRALDAIQASLQLPLNEGLANERKLFSELRNSDQARALRHVFVAERAVSKLPQHADIQSRDINKVAIIGGGTMGAGIAAAFLKSDLPVQLVERDESTLATSLNNVDKNLQGFVERGHMSGEEKSILFNKLQGTTHYEDLIDADLVIEAVFEDRDIKKEVFARLDNATKPDAILATNTSYLDINEIARTTNRPQDVIGLHFFSPAHVMRLIEIVKGEDTSHDVIATGFTIAKLLGKIGVLCGVCEGFIGNRILAHMRKQADYMIEDGALPWEIDRVMEAFGMAMGPFKVNDLSGLDIGWAMRKRLAPTRNPNERYVSIADQLCERGWFGRKSGRGWYVYDDNSQPSPNPEAESIILSESDKQGVQRKSFSSEEIQNRLVLAMVNEACNILDEGIAQRPLDIDIVEIHGYGFPRWRGGPMWYADTISLDKVITKIEEFSREDDYFWKVSPLLKHLAGNGQSFADLNSSET